MSKPFRHVPRVDAVGAQFEADEVKCRRGNNPYGHPADCPCRRASQSVPYEDDAPVFEKSPHGKWWTIPVGGA